LVWVCAVEKFCWSSVSHVVRSPYSCLTSPGSLLHTTMPRGSQHKSFQTLRCPFQGCPKTFRSQAGCTNHVLSVHPRADRHRQVIQPDIEVPASPTPSHSSTQLPDINPFPEDSSEPAEHQYPAPGPPPAIPQRKTYHPFLNGKFFFQVFFCVLITKFCVSLGCPCDENGNYLPPGTPPPPCPTAAPGDWNPFEDEVQFKVADFLYRQEEMSQGNINHLLELWALSLMKHGSVGPFDSYKDIYNRIDAIEEGNSCLSSQDLVIELNLTQGMLHGMFQDIAWWKGWWHGAKLEKTGIQDLVPWSRGGGSKYARKPGLQ